MTLPTETVYGGAPLTCPDCGVEAPGPQVMWSPAGHYIGYGGCDCGPAYSRESPYFKTRDEAEKILAAHPSEYARGDDRQPTCPHCGSHEVRATRGSMSGRVEAFCACGRWYDL